MPLVTPFQLLAFHKNNNLCPLYDGLQNPHHKLALIPPTPYNIATSHSHTEVKKVKNHLKHHIMRPLVTPFQLPTTHKNIILSPLFDVCKRRHHELALIPPTFWILVTWLGSSFDTVVSVLGAYWTLVP
jgi:hypothetical protein